MENHQEKTSLQAPIISQNRSETTTMKENPVNNDPHDIDIDIQPAGQDYDIEVEPSSNTTDEAEEQYLHAKAMALAIQNNPNLTPTEIHELMSTSSLNKPSIIMPTHTASSSTSNAKTSFFNSNGKKPSSIMPNMLTGMFGTSTAGSVTTATNAASGSALGLNNDVVNSTVKNTLNTFRDNAKKGFNDILKGTTTTSTAVPGVKVVNDPNSKPVDEITTSNKSPEPLLNEANTYAPPISPTSSMDNDSRRSLATRDEVVVTNSSLPNFDSSKDADSTNEMTVITSNKNDPCGKKDSDDDHNAKNMSQNLDTDESYYSTEFSVRKSNRDFDAAVQNRTENTNRKETKKNQVPPPTNNTQNARSHRISLSNDNAVLLPPPVRLHGICWKRRGGFGKYYKNDAWELRRIELQGTTIYYYTTENDKNVTKHFNYGDDLSVTTNGTLAGVIQQEEESGNDTGIGSTAAFTSGVKARGSIDICKEKATVHASMGHSGAPSPFAISIVVKSETKWKLCFDRHNEQMEWLAAISDIVVQNSVDSYNVQLLEAANPINVTSDGTNIVSSSIRSPPVNPDDKALDHQNNSTTYGGGLGRYNRLWMMDHYDLHSRNWGVGDTAIRVSTIPEATEDEKSTILDTHVSEVAVTHSESTEAVVNDAEVVDHSALRDHAVAASRKVWVIPQKHIMHALCILNLSVLFSRASFVSIEGFWYLLVITNMSFLLCYNKEPDWVSILDFVKFTESKEAPSAESNQVKGKAPVLSADAIPSKPKSGPIVSAETVEAVEGATRGNVSTVSDSYKPRAGSTCVKIEHEKEPAVNSKNEIFGGYRSVPGDIMQVRSHGYNSTKKKIPSPGTLYELTACDAFESPKRYPDMGSRVVLPEVKFEGEDGTSSINKTWRCPDRFVVSIALPTDPPSAFAKASSDGGGFTITMYYTMKQETRDILKRVTADGYDSASEVIDDPQQSKVNAVRLLEEWIRRSPTDPTFQARFKIIPNAHNLKEVGLPTWISSYNAKPFLIKRSGETGFLHLHPELSYAEFDVSLHPFPYLAKQAICFMKDTYFKKTVVSFGFVIEGRADDELPECLIGVVQICYPDPQYAIQAHDFFSGAAPKSYE